ncbi:hypothetical protein DFH27DRAFT_616508 [Peziza echinospora]|nr:hypothetical protein DFH27DRAFT_616508 [Peziza echinospora]
MRPTASSVIPPSGAGHYGHHNSHHHGNNSTTTTNDKTSHYQHPTQQSTQNQHQQHNNNNISRRDSHLYSSVHLASQSSGVNLRRDRAAKTLEASPIPADSNYSSGNSGNQHTSSARSQFLVTSPSTSSFKVPPAPGKKPLTLSKKTTTTGTPAAAAAPLYIKTHRKTASSAAPSTTTRPVVAVPLTPTLSSRPPTSLALASPTSPKQQQGIKRSPARFSSNGISTTAGPPPSLAYRSNVVVGGMEQNPPIVTAQPSAQRTYQKSGSAPKTPQTPARSSGGGSASTVVIRGGGGVQSTPSSAEMAMPPPPKPVRAQGQRKSVDEDRTIRGLEDLPTGGSKKNHKYNFEDDDTGMTDNDSTKDLFLSLAKADPPNLARGLNAKYKFEEKKNRLAQNRASLPAERPVSRGGNVDVSPMTTTTNASRKSVPVPSYDALAEAMEHGPRDTHSSSNRPASMLRHESSERLTTGSQRGSFTSLNPSPLQNDRTIASMIEDDNHAAQKNGDDKDSSSTVSTNAASVWDELEDLKGRLKRLEMRGNGSIKAPSDTSGGRPRTATTIATTLSSSPKNNNNSTAPPAPGTASGASPSQQQQQAQYQNALHPLLHSALTKSKPHIAPEIYKSLEATARDAFGIADIVGSNGTSGAAASPPGASGNGTIADRQMRRKVDSLCRSITELCIALSEARSHLANATVAAASPPSAHGVQAQHQQQQHLLPLRPLTREGMDGGASGRESRFLESRSGRDSVLSERQKILGGSALSNRFVVDSPRRPSMQNLITPHTASNPSLGPGILLQPSASYSDIARRTVAHQQQQEAPAAATKLARASMLMKARREQLAAAHGVGSQEPHHHAQNAAETRRRSVAETLSRDGQIDHIMHDLEMQDAGVYRTPSRSNATEQTYRTGSSSARPLRTADREREREIESLTNRFSRPALYHTRTNSSAATTVTPATTTTATTNTTAQGGARGSPLSHLRMEEFPSIVPTAAERISRRAQLTRSMHEAGTGAQQQQQMLSPVENRRFFDEDAGNGGHLAGSAGRAAGSRLANRNTVHADFTGGRYASAAGTGVELKRKSQPAAMSSTSMGTRREYGVSQGDEMTGIEHGGVNERSIGSGEGRRFLRRRVE